MTKGSLFAINSQQKVQDCSPFYFERWAAINLPTFSKVVFDARGEVSGVFFGHAERNYAPRAKEQMIFAMRKRI